MEAQKMYKILDLQPKIRNGRNVRFVLLNQNQTKSSDNISCSLQIPQGLISDYYFNLILKTVHNAFLLLHSNFCSSIVKEGLHLVFLNQFQFPLFQTLSF